MKIKELDEEEPGSDCSEGFEIVRVSGAKRALVGAGARVLFYPTLLYNVFRNKIQAEFRWWDKVDQFLLLGAVPFPNDVPRLRHLGVRGVITLNESYETLVPTTLYEQNASCGRTTYVHCKAGRGRSTTIVLCYLVEHRRMTPKAAFDYVRSIRPRVLLAPSQWRAVQEYWRLVARPAINTPQTAFKFPFK
ncbi:putative dual specificity protein phosphatase DSP8 [Acorus calamus]|uniref:Dual specificity protein phosphatase DSP8 n=1 Tax=Acorus calamus TaxID=4465 RepID=A0AAV9CN59_ACOCL|nr:putative dual specificity protein phosphatase DSP8 [Acorus calamus]